LHSSSKLQTLSEEFENVTSIMESGRVKGEVKYKPMTNRSFGSARLDMRKRANEKALMLSACQTLEL